MSAALSAIRRAKKPFGLALNPVHKEIYVSDMRLNGVVTFSMPELFEPSRTR